MQWIERDLDGPPAPFGSLDGDRFTPANDIDMADALDGQLMVKWSAARVDHPDGRVEWLAATYRPTVRRWVFVPPD